MSYCRFSDGDVYMYDSVKGGLHCCACRLGDETLEVPWDWGPDVVFHSRLDAHEHLMEHKEAGHSVPQYAFDMLVEEIAEWGDEV